MNGIIHGLLSAALQVANANSLTQQTEGFSQIFGATFPLFSQTLSLGSSPEGRLRQMSGNVAALTRLKALVVTAARLTG